MAVHDAYGKEVSPDLFTKSVLGFRRIQHVFHSPRGIKRTALGNIVHIGNIEHGLHGKQAQLANGILLFFGKVELQGALAFVQALEHFLGSFTRGNTLIPQ